MEPWYCLVLARYHFRAWTGHQRLSISSLVIEARVGIRMLEGGDLILGLESHSWDKTNPVRLPLNVAIRHGGGIKCTTVARCDHGQQKGQPISSKGGPENRRRTSLRSQNTRHLTGGRAIKIPEGDG